MNAWLLSDIGRSIGGYALDAVAARGRGSVVFLARRGTGPRVALKISRQAHLQAVRGERDFGREHCIAAAAAHPHILRVHGHGVAGADAFLALEHACGGALSTLPLPADPRQVFAWALQASSALAHLHTLGWVHRDVKPANLLLRADGTLALADFGSACTIGDLPPPGRLVGTPRYAAPEQQQGAAALPAADVYALGAVLFEWLTASPPFVGETALELQARHLMAELPALPDPLSAWQPLIHAMLAKMPGQRPQDGRALHDRLQRESPVLLQNACPGSPAGARNLP